MSLAKLNYLVEFHRRSYKISFDILQDYKWSILFDRFSLNKFRNIIMEKSAICLGGYGWVGEITHRQKCPGWGL